MFKLPQVLSAVDQGGVEIKSWSFEEFITPKKLLLKKKSEKELKEKQKEEIEASKKEFQKSGFEEGKKEGYEEGYKEGLEAAGKEMAPLKQELASMLQLLEPTAIALEKQSLDAIVQLCYQIANMVIKTESKINPAVLEETLKEVFDTLPSSLAAYTLSAHENNVEEIERYIQHHHPEVQLKIQIENTLLPGGVRLQGPTVYIDASLEQRLLHLIQQ